MFRYRDVGEEKERKATKLDPFQYRTQTEEKELDLLRPRVFSLSSLRPDICEGKARTLKELEEAEN